VALLDSLFFQPLTSVAAAAAITGRTFANTNNLIARLESRGLLTEISGRRRHRRFCYQPFLTLMQSG
jgi:Fic family protein